MATNQKLLPCPKCGRTDDLEVYDYDGCKHVECNNGFNSTPAPGTTACHYLGPPAGSARMAIKAYNDSVRNALAKAAA